MSFKRDGDEPGQLAALQKRRVAELLANYIPEDEALLLRSGRYACTVCAHRPVFDTLEVLAVHRAGRKHLGSLQRCYGSERWREDAAQEQRHEELVRVEVAGAQGSWKRRTRGEDPAGAEHCPGSLAGGQGRRGGHPCSPAARAPQQASRCAEGSFHPRRARQKRKSSVVIASESARSPQPCEAPGAGAVPAAAERRLDPGSLWQVGEG
ncbi:sodium channel modifier 1 isoform X3 [Anser cygnoides]|uniref:sodium channel modifier 1 isoform X3 n=1 Tax=Anser cygnoides TaxID=8845 RepID=UPI0034D1B18A